METLELLSDNSEFSVYKFFTDNNDYFLLLYDKATNTLYMALSDIAELLGYPDENDMLSSDLALDILSAIQKETGSFPVKGYQGSIKLLRRMPLK